MEMFTFCSSPTYVQYLRTLSSWLMATQHVGELPNTVVYLLYISHNVLSATQSSLKGDLKLKGFWMNLHYGIRCWLRMVCRSLGASCSCRHYSCRPCCVASLAMCDGLCGEGHQEDPPVDNVAMFGSKRSQSSLRSCHTHQESQPGVERSRYVLEFL